MLSNMDGLFISGTFNASANNLSLAPLTDQILEIISTLLD